MEPPDTWVLLTSSLIVCNLGEPRRAWAFLVVQGLVRDAADERERFLAILAEEEARGPITGPSLAHRITGKMIAAGLVLPGGTIPDPRARIAADHLGAIAAWGPDALGSQESETLQWMKKWHGSGPDRE